MTAVEKAVEALERLHQVLVRFEESRKNKRFQFYFLGGEDSPSPR